MAAPATVTTGQPLETTLLDLVLAVSEVAETEAEVVATVHHMVRSGRVQLRGNFRGSMLEDV
jgi:hypothetical protein